MDNVIYLADEYGNEVPYEVIDQINIASEEFAALIHRNDDGTEDLYFVAVKYSGVVAAYNINSLNSFQHPIRIRDNSDV